MTDTPSSEKYAEMPVFDHSKVHKGIHAISDAMDSLEMTLFERWYACHSIEAAARAMLGPKFLEWCEKNAEELGIPIDIPVEAEAEATE